MSIVAGAQSNLEQMVTLLSDPKALKARHAQLAEAQRQAQEVLDKVGPAQDILLLRSQLAAELEATKKANEEAAKERRKLFDEAWTKANVIVEQARADAAALIEQAQKRVEAAEVLHKEASAHAEKVQAEHEVVQGRERDLDDLQVILTGAQEAHATREREHEARVQAFHDAHKTFIEAIGAPGA